MEDELLPLFVEEGIKPRPFLHVQSSRLALKLEYRSGRPDVKDEEVWVARVVHIEKSYIDPDNILVILREEK